MKLSRCLFVLATLFLIGGCSPSSSGSDNFSSKNDEPLLQTNYHVYSLKKDFTPISKEVLIQDVNQKYSFECEYAHLNFSYNDGEVYSRVTTIKRKDDTSSSYPKYIVPFGYSNSEMVLVDQIIESNYEIECTKDPYSISVYADSSHNNKKLYVEYNDTFNPIRFEDALNASGLIKGDISYFDKTDLPKGPGKLSYECGIDCSFFSWQNSTRYVSRTIEIVGAIDEYSYQPPTMNEASKQELVASYKGVRVVEQLNLSTAIATNIIKNDNTAPYLILQDDEFITSNEGNVPTHVIHMINDCISNSGSARAGATTQYRDGNTFELDQYGNLLYSYVTPENNVGISIKVKPDGMAEEIVWKNPLLMKGNVLVRGEFEAHFSYSTELSDEEKTKKTELSFDLSKLNSDSYQIDLCKDISSNVTIPSNYLDCPITAICEESFANNNNINRLYVPKTITSIGNSAFANCPYLREIIYEGSLEEWDLINLGDNWLPSCVLNVKCSDDSIRVYGL